MKMTRDPLHTKLCDMLEIEYPVIAFTHCKDVATAVINAGGFAVLGEAMHTPEDIRADIKWIRDRIGDKQFGIDLVLPASATAEFDLEAMLAEIPDEHRQPSPSKSRRSTTSPPPKGLPGSAPVGRPQPEDRPRSARRAARRARAGDRLGAR